ncbi:MAG: sensor histidine kinase [Lachnospiraceae bacterium]|nr:sensor histidine kinase [Lachnospiraceae bacterium]
MKYLPYQALTLILIFTATFLMWFFIFGRRAVQKEGRETLLQKAGYIGSALPCFLMSLLIFFDIHKAMAYLEGFGDAALLHRLFYPVSAMAAVFLLIPFCVTAIRNEALIPGISAELTALTAVFLVGLLCLCVIREQDTPYSALCFLAAALLSILIIHYTPLLSRDRYQAELKKIDGMLTEARNAHYEAVRKSSLETRRSRHDMKNHLIAMKELAMQSRKEELIAYIDSITEQIEAAAPPYRSGNDIADVIIADKNAKAQKRGLELCISGNLAGLDIETADLVTILSNLLDNAIEAVNRLYGRERPEEDKRIWLEFKKNRNFILILERNKSITGLKPGRIVSSKNSPDHGFGILNIKRAVKKYGGEYHISCTEEGDIYLVEIEIILPLKE